MERSKSTRFGTLVLISIGFLIFAGLFNPVYAQIERDTVPDSLTFKYNLNVTGMYKKGRLNQLMIPVSTYGSISNKTIGVEMLVRYIYHTINGFVLENELLTRTVLTILPNNKIHPVGGYMYENSQLYQLKYRHSPGLGIGIHVLVKPRHKILLHTFASYDQTAFYGIDGYETFRANVIIWGRHQLVKKKLDFNYRLFYLQSVQDASNYIIRIEPKLMFRLNKHLSFTVNLDYRLETIVDPVNTKENSSLTAGLQWSGSK